MATAANGKPKQGDAVFERQLPNDLQAEQGVIGSVFLLATVLPEVRGIVQAGDFYDDANRLIFKATLAIADAGKPLDHTLLVAKLREAGDLEAIGGTRYLADVLGSVPHAANAAYYAEIVAEHAIRRRIIESFTGLLASAYGNDDPAELVRQANDALAIVAGRVADQRASIRTLGEAAREVAAEHQHQDAPSTVNRAMTGIPSVDDALGPMMPGELIVVAARPAMGKTSLAHQVLFHSATQDRPCLMVSLEMTDCELASRDICRIADIDSRALRAGNLTDAERAKMVPVAEDLATLPYYVWAPATASVSEIRAVVSKAVNKHGIRLVAVDYYTLIDGERGTREDRRQQLVRISRGLKAIAKEYNVPLICLAQLNRDGDSSGHGKGKASTAEPTLKHLAECSAIEQDANTVLFIHRDSGMPHDQRVLIAAKGRAFQVGKLTLKWTGKRTEFSDLHAADHGNYEPTFDDWNRRCEPQAAEEGLF